MNILVKLPTRSRPKKANEVLLSFMNRQSGKHSIMYLLTTDEDDPTRWDLITGGTVREICGRSLSKIHAVNRDMDKVREPWDILVLISDDQFCVTQDWDDIIAQAMPEHLDACLHFNDGNRGPELNTLPIMGRARYDKFGYIYHPSYVSMWCDNEFTEVHRPIYIDRVIIVHRHPAYHADVKADAQLRATEAWNGVDKNNYYVRKMVHNFNPRFPKLTLGICTIPGREMDYRRLRYVLDPQLHSDVEVIVDPRPSISATTGFKRQDLLDQALGEFVCFIDDDDLVAHNYVERILKALHENPLTDAVGFTGEMTTAGVNPRRMVHHWRKGRETWGEDPQGNFIRGPTHLNPIRTCLARRTGFKDITYAEDFDYAQRVHPLIRSGINLDDPPLYYYLFQFKKRPRVSPKSPSFKKR